MRSAGAVAAGVVLVTMALAAPAAAQSCNAAHGAGGSNEFAREVLGLKNLGEAVSPAARDGVVGEARSTFSRVLSEECRDS